MVEFRTHELTKVLSYVSTQQSGQFDTFLFNHFSAHLEIYGSQTTNFRGSNKSLRMIFERVFNQWSPKKSTHILEKYFKNAHAKFCSAVQNLRLVRIKLA